jgi:hypothetical protein
MTQWMQGLQDTVLGAAIKETQLYSLHIISKLTNELVISVGLYARHKSSDY